MKKSKRKLHWITMFDKMKPEKKLSEKFLEKMAEGSKPSFVIYGMICQLEGELYACRRLCHSGSPAIISRERRLKKMAEILKIK